MHFIAYKYIGSVANNKMAAGDNELNKNYKL